MDAAVGILALQGDFAAHAAALARVGVPTRLVRRPEHLRGIGGLVLPGGESTTMLRLCHLQRLTEPLTELLRSDLPVLATCAGVILLAREVVDPVQWSFGALDVGVARNGWGRQIHSGRFDVECGDGATMSAVFIRAPRIVRVGPGVTVLARRAGEPVLVRQGAIVGACFHPELEERHPLIDEFAAAVRRRSGQSERVAELSRS